MKTLIAPRPRTRKLTLGLVATLATAVVALAAALAAAAATAAPAPSRGTAAEFAVKWQAGASGPRTLEDVGRLLEWSDPKAKTFETRYVTVTQPRGLPADTKVIVRERQEGGETRTTYKMRGPENAKAFIDAAACALSRPDPKETKREFDVLALGKLSESRSYAFSCSAAGPASGALPAALEGERLPCSVEVRRLKRGAFKAESWALPGGAAVLEVSMNGLNDAASRRTFADGALTRLLDAGIAPLADSKTELASRCP